MGIFEEAINILKKNKEDELLKQYISSKNKKDLTEQILNIDFNKQHFLFEETKTKSQIINDEIKPINAIDKNKMTSEDINVCKQIGKSKIENGKLAIVTLAGGQGTRLGHNGPKGTYMLVPNKSLFEILCDKLKKANDEYNTIINWYIMTSKENNNDVISFFKANNYFNYSKEHITFFKQRELPMNTLDGKLFLNENGLIKQGANGHGGVFEAFIDNNLVNDFKEKNIEWLFVTPIDNPLIELVDELFVGIAERNNYEIIGKCVQKENPKQKSGVFCLQNNKTKVIEYSEIAEELASKKDENGNLFLSNAHINCNMFNVSILDHISKVDIPYHIAKKKATYIEKDGNIVKPEEPNAYKYEKFIFDYFPYFQNIGIYNVEAEKEYAPIKDNADKARQMYLKKYNIN